MCFLVGVALVLTGKQMRKNIRRRYGFESGREINRTFLDDRSPHQKQNGIPEIGER